MVERRRQYYSTALSHSLGMIPECLLLFEHWQEEQTLVELLEDARALNLLSTDSNRRLRNVVIEGFGSRFFREPHVSAAPFLKHLFASSSPRLTLDVILLYTLRQHGIFFDFMTDIYWPAVRAGRTILERPEIFSFIDRGRIDGKLAKDWSVNMRNRVCGYLLGVAHDFELVGPSSRGNRPLQHWTPTESLILYLAYDLHFLELGDDQMIIADEWSAFGFERADVLAHLNRLGQRGHLTIQDSGVVCRVHWQYSDRSQLNDALLRG